MTQKAKQFASSPPAPPPVVSLRSTTGYSLRPRRGRWDHRIHVIVTFTGGIATQPLIAVTPPGSSRGSHPRQLSDAPCGDFILSITRISSPIVVLLLLPGRLLPRRFFARWLFGGGLRLGLLGSRLFGPTLPRSEYGVVPVTEFFVFSHADPDDAHDNPPRFL
jgi:hypothetical protein